MDYVSLAIGLKILSNEEAVQFLNCPILFPGGAEVGTFPTSWVCATLNQLEHIGREFVVRSKPRLLTYDSYQVRAVGFLSERLGSFLLLAELARRYDLDIGILSEMAKGNSMIEAGRFIVSQIPAKILGRMFCCISKGEKYNIGHANLNGSNIASPE